MKAFCELKLLFIYFKELTNKSGEIVLYIYIGLIDASDFFTDKKWKLGLKLLTRLIIKTSQYDFEKFVVFYKRITSKIILLL
jgi:hypothetical protein